MDDVVSSQSLEASPRRSARWRKLAVVAVLCVGGLTSVAYHELRTSATQSWLLSRYAASLSYAIEPGPSPSIAFPRGGPFDAQRGYPRLGDFSRRLASAGYTVAEQARCPPTLRRTRRPAADRLRRAPRLHRYPRRGATSPRRAEPLRDGSPPSRDREHH